MKESINELRKQSEFLVTMIIKAVTRKGNIAKIYPRFPKDGKWDIKLTMNGVELPIIEAFKDIEDAIDSYVAEEAHKLICDKFSDLQDIIYDLTEQAKRDFAEKLGVKYEEY